MKGIKIMSILFLGLFITNNCFSQKKKSSSTNLKKFFKTASKDLVTNESIKKSKENKPLSTLSLYYTTETISATVKND